MVAVRLANIAKILVLALLTTSVLAGCTLTKAVSPNPAPVGQPITFTITETSTDSECSQNFGGTCTDIVDDTLPSSVTFVSASPNCNMTSPGQVSCLMQFGDGQSDTATITVIPNQCGDFTNNVASEFENVNNLQASAPFTVVCPQTQQPSPQQTPQQRQPSQQQPVCPPASQGVANESQNGSVSPSFDVTGSGNNSNQTAAPLQFGNTGSNENAQGVLQTCGSQSGNVELEGGDMNFSPTLDTSTNQRVGQSSGSSS